MKIKWLAFALATLLAISTLFLIPRIQRKIPDIPGNITHSTVTKIGECIQCHIIAGIRPLPSDHAARDKCLYCHRMKDK